MEKTKVILGKLNLEEQDQEFLTKELKLRDREIDNLREKINIFVNSLKALKFKIPKDQEFNFSKDFIEGYHVTFAIFKQKLEEAIFDATEEYRIRLELEEK